MATIQERLTEAEDAYHALQTGSSAVEVRDSDGGSVRYTPANSARLFAYIQDLKRQLGTAEYSGPMRVIF